MTGTGLPHGVTQYGEAEGTFHVPEFPVSYSGGTGGNGATASLQHVWDAHASGGAHQAPLDGNMRSEYADEVAETGCGDNGKVYGCNLQTHGVTHKIRVKSYNESIQYGYRIYHRIVSYKKSIQYGYRICCTSSNGISIMYQIRCSNVQLHLTIIYQLNHLTCYTYNLLHGT